MPTLEGGRRGGGGGQDEKGREEGEEEGEEERFYIRRVGLQAKPIMANVVYSVWQPADGRYFWEGSLEMSLQFLVTAVSARFRLRRRRNSWPSEPSGDDVSPRCP